MRNLGDCLGDVARYDDGRIDDVPSILTEASSEETKLCLKSSDLAKNDRGSWNLHEKIGAMLATKIAAELTELEKRLGQLNAEGNASPSGNRRAGKSPGSKRRAYPSVLPKYQNPAPPFETWSGRGKWPRWLNAQLVLGKQLDDFRIGPSLARRKLGSAKKKTQ